MDTVKIDHGNVKMVAHRGVSKLERENTNPAFVAAGNRSYFGIETDVRISKDGRFVLLHDSNPGRFSVGGEKPEVAETDYAELLKVAFKDVGSENTRSDLHIALLEDYISICKKYEKVAVLELKQAFDDESVAALCRFIGDMDYLDHTHFITFHTEYIDPLLANKGGAEVSFLTSKYEDGLLDWLVEKGIGLDIDQHVLTREIAAEIKARGIYLNCWTVDKPERAAELISFGVDMITTNILE